MEFVQKIYDYKEKMHVIHFNPKDILGEVIVRCSGRRVEDSDGMIVLEGYHRIINNIESTV